MKKFLTMALALMMILSLFAVPTMAATIDIDVIKNGSFDSIAAGTAITTSTSESFGVKSNSATATVVNIAATEGLPANGTSVNALQISNKTAGGSPEAYTNTFNLEANKVYKLSLDFLAKEAPGTGFALRVYSNGSLGSVRWSTDGTTWNSPTTSPSYLCWSSVALDTWHHKEVYVKHDTGLTNAYVVLFANGGITEQDAAGVVWYLDNVSVTTQSEVAAVTKTVTGNGTITGIDDFAALNSSHTLTLTPASTSYLKALTVNGTDVIANVTEAFDATANYFYYTYPITFSADTTIAAEFADYTLVGKFADDMDSIDYEITTAGSEEVWSRGSTAVVAIESEATKGNVMHVSSGNAKTPQRAYELGRYKLSFDAKADTKAGPIRLSISGVTPTWNSSTSNANYNHNITTEWASYELYIDINSFTSGDETTLRVLDINHYPSINIEGFKLDNVTIQKLSKTAPVTPPVVEPTEFDVVGTTNNEAYGTVVASAATSEGEAVTFTVTPKLGYYVSAATLNGENALASFENVYEVSTITVAEVTEDVTLAVEFAAVTAKGENVATLPAVFEEAGTAVTFGKVLDTTDATSWGVELTKDGVGVTPYHGGSYLYKANATNTNGQYAIEFIGLEPGEYQIRSYVYVNGVATFGAPSTFVVD